MTAENTTQTDQQQDQTETTSSGLSTADLASASQSTSAQAGDTQVETRPSGAGESAPLFNEDEAQGFRDRWSSVQGSFVDDPRRAVQEADELVADTIQRLAQIFADERNELESQWSSGGDVSTEDLRLALQRYRSFFDRLLSV